MAEPLRASGIRLPRLNAARWRRVLPALFAAALFAGCSENEAAADAGGYGRPGTLVKLADGRSLNLRCSGHGSPTVIFESGFGANSAAWAKVQPQIAGLTRACSYDRAGADFSDPGPLPRDGAAIARDLDQALTHARINGPYVLVAHSAGGLYARLLAARRLKDVRGLVLLDPTVERIVPEGQPDGLEGIRRRVQRCLAAAETHAAPDDAQWSGCVNKKTSPHAQEMARRPETWRQQLSELDAIFGRTSDEVRRSGDLLRAIPTYVITASETAAASQMVGYDHPQSITELEHVRLALAADHGAQRTVYSSHLIMIDRPEVVVDAVTEMVRAAREGRAPEGLPPSEGGQPGEEAPFEQNSTAPK